MRWFFLFCLVAAALIGNLAIFEKLDVSRLIGGACFNVFIAALFGFWWSAYFANVFDKDRTTALSIFALLFASGIGLASHAIQLLVANQCPHPSHRRGLLSGLLQLTVDAGLCKEVLYVYLASSGLLLLLSFRALALARRRF